MKRVAGKVAEINGLSDSHVWTGKPIFLHELWSFTTGFCFSCQVFRKIWYFTVHWRESTTSNYFWGESLLASPPCYDICRGIYGFISRFQIELLLQRLISLVVADANNLTNSRNCKNFSKLVPLALSRFDLDSDTTEVKLSELFVVSGDRVFRIFPCASS